MSPTWPASESTGGGSAIPASTAGSPRRIGTSCGGSRGEITAVKSGYARGRTGWVSDRTACYLAAGRPAVVQETAIGGATCDRGGLVAFEGTDQAPPSHRARESDYTHHARRARSWPPNTSIRTGLLRRLLDIAGV